VNLIRDAARSLAAISGLFALAAILAFLALAIGTTVLAGVYVSINEAGKDSTVHAWMAAGATAGAWAYLGAFFCRYGKKERAEAPGYAAVLGVCAIGLVVAAHHTISRSRWLLCHR
jgi:hypothetical protein